MTRKSVKGAAVLGVLLLVLTLATTTYAKLVVLSFGFDSSIQGFTASVQSVGTGSCTTSPIVTQSSGTLQIALSAGGCSTGGNIIITKLVVLSSGLGSPSIDMLIRDSNHILNLDNTKATLSSVGTPSAKVVVLGSDEMSGGWYGVSGVWGASASSGNATLQITIPINAGSWGVTKYVAVDNIFLNDESR